jgi:hypothetical protein
MNAYEFYILGACALWIALVALRQFVRARRATPSEWTTPILLLVTAAMLTLAAVEVRKWSERSALAVMDTSSVHATFLELATEGSQRQLVFRYRVQNTAHSDFVLDTSACSAVSFRFEPGAKYDPASALLEPDTAAHQRYTGLVRFAHRPMELRPCPLVLKPGQSQDVAIAIPYAYPGNFGTPEEANLRTYLRATMRHVDGFGAADSRGSRGILFPKAW